MLKHLFVQTSKFSCKVIVGNPNLTKDQITCSEAAQVANNEDAQCIRPAIGYY